MARNKRASMREGPLADLFRSTAKPEEEQPTKAGRDEPVEQETRVLPPTEPARDRAEPESAEPQPFDHSDEPVEESRPAPDPEPVRAYRLEERGVERVLPEPKDRLSRIFADEPLDPEPPMYGRDDPSSYEAPSGPPRPHEPIIRVVGVGGAGVNAVNRMVDARIPGVEFMAINTDLQSLQQSSADVTVHLGSGVARGLGAGSDPELGYKAAFEEQDKIKRLLKGSDMVFVTAGVGGGTGTGAAPVIARLSRDVGALTVGIVTKPFKFEGTRRSAQAERGIEAMSQEVDTLIVVPNERLLSVLARTTTMTEAFQVADDVLRQGVQGISELITLPGLINLDFADVRTTMRDAGQALLGIGMGTGENRASFAADRAIASPLLDTSVDGARSILLSITGGRDLSLLEVSEAAKVVHEAAHPDANIIFGANVDPSLADQVWVTVIATRFDGRGRRSDGNGGSQRRAAGTTQAAIRRPADRRAGTAKSFKSRPRDLNIEVPEFLPK
ncbi:MAG: cell division protein FtsZ [Solirubrobacterales bacterium]|jgi:cell division protein FtsZ|nr:cell division protein FtsZ [Solirubrobacterales bacterium]